MIPGESESLIEIVLPTFNGERFLGEQLESIRAQSHTCWRLLIRDDCSTDETVSILRAFAAAHPDRVHLLEVEGGNLGVVRNCSRILENTSADYVAFSDQDDVWLSHKLSRCLAQMRLLEEQWGRDCPLLVFSDLQVVDEDLSRVHKSFWAYHGIRPESANRFAPVLATNAVSGCTMLFNAPLRRLVLPIPNEAFMHDWWIALTACAFGHISAIHEPLLLYRRHGMNSIGPRRPILRALNYALNIQAGRDRVSRWLEQANAFRERFGDHLSSEQQTLLDTFINLPHRSIIERIYLMKKNGIGYNNNVLYLIGISAIIGSI